MPGCTSKVRSQNPGVSGKALFLCLAWWVSFWGFGGCRALSPALSPRVCVGVPTAGHALWATCAHTGRLTDDERKRADLNYVESEV